MQLQAVKNRWRVLAESATIRADLHRFRKFHRRLASPSGNFHIFFTGAMLHWVHACVSAVPEHVALVLMGSGLDEEEIAWVRAHVDRPFFAIRAAIDDKTAWQMLFDVNEGNFGWLDVDCFVHEPGIFAEMADLPAEAGINCLWHYDPLPGLSLLRTHMLYLRANAIRDLRAAGLEPSPMTYNFEGSFAGREQTRSVSRIPTPRQTALLRRYLPAGPDQRPLYPAFQGGKGVCGPDGYFDTLIVYQLLADSIGYRLNHVRRLDVSVPADWMTDEVVHVGSSSYYRNFKQSAEPHARRVYETLLRVERMLLAGMPSPPARYRSLALELGRDLEDCGIGGTAAELPVIAGRSLAAWIRELNAEVLSPAGEPEAERSA